MFSNSTALQKKVYKSSNFASQQNIKKCSSGKVQNTKQNEKLTNNFFKKKVFALPNVKELAEQFMNHECTTSTHAISQREIEFQDKSLIKQKSLDAINYNRKQVHSLTARSISKEFREGLKSNSCQKSSVKSKTGEAKAVNTICRERSPSPTPTINLQNIKKFWEEIITANSTLQNL